MADQFDGLGDGEVREQSTGLHDGGNQAVPDGGQDAVAVQVLLHRQVHDLTAAAASDGMLSRMAKKRTAIVRDVHMGLTRTFLLPCSKL